MDVRKSDNSLQAFKADKIIAACMNAGVSLELSTEIASEVKAVLYDSMPTSEVRSIVYEKLKKFNPDIADRFMYRLNLRVRTSKIMLETFKLHKIADSLMAETDLDEVHALKIARDVEKELSRLKLDYVTAPLIREIVNVKLLEHGFENTRARYTRLGMPVYDVTALIMGGSGDGRQYNPDTIEDVMAEQMILEYTLLNVLPSNLADAHLAGRIHIHDIGHFPIRTYSFSHDLRFFLKSGFRADGVGKYSATSGPPKNPEVAFLQAAKILGAAQTSCVGGQGLNYFNTFMAPYVSGLDAEEITQLAQVFIYELSQTYSTQGLFSCVQCNLTLPAQLQDLPAVLPSGLVRKDVTYSDFQDEADRILSALIQVYTRGDHRREGFNMPKLELQISKKEMDHDILSDVAVLSSKHGSPSFTVNRKYMSKFRCYQNSAYLMPLAPPVIRKDTLAGYLRGGCAQMVTVNLPQIALEANGDDRKIFRLIGRRVADAKNVLLLKRQTLEDNLENGLFPFFSQKVDKGGGLYFEPDRQTYLIGFAGLDDMAYISTGSRLDSKTGLEFGLKVVRRMSRLVSNFARESDMLLALAESPVGTHNRRLWEVDSLRHRNKIEKLGLDFDRYSLSYHLREGVGLKKTVSTESKFHCFLGGGATLDVPLAKNYPAGKILAIVRELVAGSEAQHFRFVRRKLQKK